MDATPFAQLKKDGFDILALYDYTGFENGDTNRRELDSLANMAAAYSEIVVVAWSFGVRIAAEFLRRSISTLPVTGAIAVNGTTVHIHSSCGIPESIFNGTLQNLSPANVRKFNRRMFASAADFATYTAHATQRSFESLLAELRTFAKLPPVPHRNLFSMAIIGSADAIFPPANQLEGWRGATVEMMEGTPHFCNLQQIIDNFIVDKARVADRFSRAAATYAANATPQQAVAAKLWEISGEPVLNALTLSSHPSLIEIGSGSGTLTRLYFPHLPAGTSCEMWDIAARPVSFSGAGFRQCDAETEIRSLPPASCDCIISASTIQWFNSPAGFIGRLATVLAPGGVAAIALYGPLTYREISSLTGRGLHYLPLQRLTEAAEAAGLKVLHASENTFETPFPDAAAMLRHIKLTGVNGNSSSTRMAMKVMRTYASGNPATLTYNPIYLVLKQND